MKGVQIRIREGRNGDELSQMLSKVALEANLFNKLSRANNQAMTYIAKQSTLGRLLIIGGAQPLPTKNGHGAESCL